MRRALGLALIASMTTACSAAAEPTAEPATGVGRDYPALALASAVFVGEPAAEAIKAQLDLAFANHGLEPTDENYSRAGSVLVALRNQQMEAGCDACTEMAILDAMLVNHVDGLDFPDMAAWSAVFIATGAA